MDDDVKDEKSRRKLERTRRSAGESLFGSTEEVSDFQFSLNKSAGIDLKLKRGLKTNLPN